jgi:vancomycin resistance protein YoaR
VDGNERKSAPDDADAAGAPTKPPEQDASSARPEAPPADGPGDAPTPAPTPSPEANGPAPTTPGSAPQANGPAPTTPGSAPQANGPAPTTPGSAPQATDPGAPPAGPAAPKANGPGAPPAGPAAPKANGPAPAAPAAPSAPGATTPPAGPAPTGAQPDVPSGAPSTAPPPGAGPPAYGASRGAPPKIFDLPDEQRPGKPNGGDGTIVLGGAAAAEGRTTGPNPRIAGPASGTSRLSDPPTEATAETAEDRGRHFSSPNGDGESRNWWPLGLAAIPVVALVLLIGGWAVDTVALSGQVMRNVEVAGRPVGGLSEASLPEVMGEVDQELASRPVVVTSGDRRYETTAGDLGLTVDAEATAEAALDAGRDDSLLARPVTWLSSFFSPREVDVQYSVQESQVVAKMLELQGPELLAPHDPTIQLGDQGWVAVPGTPGQGVDTDEIVAGLPAQADATPSGTIEVEASTVEVAPRFTDAEAQALADDANARTANGITLTAGEASKQVSAEQLRTWIAPTTANGALELAILPDTVNAELPTLFADVSAEPVDASFDLQNGTPVVVPSQQGIACCGPTSPDLVMQALIAGEATVALEVTVTEPHVTTEAAQALGIVGPVGGNNAWRDGGATTAGPGFTTYHAGGQSRVTNIHRMADMVRGAIILPGETFSINDHVGPRTAAKGFVPAGAIREGEHVDEIGGGVSQFATTAFNAAYFAGLDIPVSQAHSEYFDRYPLGREATMGHPNPDLQITNDTPYGVMIWTSYTDTSLTVTMYSSPYATAAQTGISESMSGACRVVTTTRTRTFPDGRSENDTFKATYRPGPGLSC